MVFTMQVFIIEIFISVQHAGQSQGRGVSGVTQTSCRPNDGPIGKL